MPAGDRKCIISFKHVDCSFQAFVFRNLVAAQQVAKGNPSHPSETNTDEDMLNTYLDETITDVDIINLPLKACNYSEAKEMYHCREVF